jgi:L-asparaginase II
VLGPVPLVKVIRSGVEEAVHLGSVVVADEYGDLVASTGDPGRVAFARSTTKPLQAAVSLSLAGEEVTDPEVALMCASHNGEPVHLEVVLKLLDRAGVGVDALRCPPALPLDPEAARAVAGPSPELHNCSGKHAGMLLASVRRGFELDSYIDPTHPVQMEILSAVEAAAGGAPAGIGIDGCGIPVHAYPLVSLASVYARLARPERLGSLAPTVERAVESMSAEPYLVAGRDRICTAVMQAVPGIIVKAGAEGLLCAAVLARGVGITVKVEDGSGRACGPALVRTLKQLGVLSGEEEAALAVQARPLVLGGGRAVGDLRAEFDLAFA